MHINSWSGASQRRLYEMAREACDLGDVEELCRLAAAVSVCEAAGTRSMDDLAYAMDCLPEGLDAAKAAEAMAYVSAKRFLSHHEAHSAQRRVGAPSKPWEKDWPAWTWGRNSDAWLQDPQAPRRQRC